MAAHGEQNGSLQRLECVPVNECGDFTAKLLHALKTLKSVDIESCKSLEEVFELGEADEGSSEEKELPLLSSLTELHLSFLPELKCIWKGPTRHVSLQNLFYLELLSLNKLTFIFTPSLARSLPKLKRLYISKCGQLKHIIREEDGDRDIIPESPRFPKLKTLRISQCGKLKYVFPVSMSLTLQSLPQLETLEIRDCFELEHIIKEEDGEREIIPESPGFLKLKTLYISHCGKLEYVFPVSVSLTIQSLPQLQTLETRDCRELEHIIREKDGENNCHKMVTVLPNLQELSLKQLPSIFRFSQGCFEFLFPRLEKLKVYECRKLTTKFAITPDRLMSAQSEVLLI